MSAGQGVASSNLASPTKPSTPSDLVGYAFTDILTAVDDAERRPLRTNHGPPGRTQFDRNDRDGALTAPLGLHQTPRWVTDIMRAIPTGKADNVGWCRCISWC